MGRNLVKLKKNDDVISNSKVVCYNRHFHVATTTKAKIFIVSLVFG